MKTSDSSNIWLSFRFTSFSQSISLIYFHYIFMLWKSFRIKYAHESILTHRIYEVIGAWNEVIAVTIYRTPFNEALQPR